MNGSAPDRLRAGQRERKEDKKNPAPGFVWKGGLSALRVTGRGKQKEKDRTENSEGKEKRKAGKSASVISP